MSDNVTEDLSPDELLRELEAKRKEREIVHAARVSAEARDADAGRMKAIRAEIASVEADINHDFSAVQMQGREDAFIEEYNRLSESRREVAEPAVDNEDLSEDQPAPAAAEDFHFTFPDDFSVGDKDGHDDNVKGDPESEGE